MAKSFSFLMSFCSPFYFPTKDCFLFVSRSTFLYFLFSRTSSSTPARCLSSSVLPSLFSSPPSALSSHVLPFSSAFSYLVLPMFVPHFPSQNPLEHARSMSLLQRISFPSPLPFPFVLPCIVDFTLIFFYCDKGVFLHFFVFL